MTSEDPTKTENLDYAIDAEQICPISLLRHPIGNHIMALVCVSLSLYDLPTIT